MNILAVNVDSTSIKYAVFDGDDELIKGKVDVIQDDELESKSFTQSFREITETIRKQKIDIKLIGHKIIHGGNADTPSMADKKTLTEIEKLMDHFYLHNPAQIEMIDVCSKIYPKVKQVLCFDTGLFTKMDEGATIYPISPELANKYKIKRYGHDSIAHLYAAETACTLTKKKIKQEKIISCVLGFNSSVCAIQKGEGIQTTTGFTRLEGLPGILSSGSIDPTIMILLMDEELYTTDEMLDILNKNSGIGCLYPKIEDLKKGKDKKAKLIIELMQHEAIKSIGAMAASLNGPSMIVFSGELIQENPVLREAICKNLEYLGVKIDKKKNNKDEGIITDSKSKIKVCNIVENELLMITKLAQSLIKK